MPTHRPPVVVDWVRMELDLARFRPDRVDVPALSPAQRVTTLGELGDTAAHRRDVYELDRACAADIPDREDFFTFEEYVGQRFGSPGYRPDGQVLLLDGEQMVGLCAISLRPDRSWAFIEMSGVLPGHRGRGFSTLLKVRALTAAQRWGATAVRTIHHPASRAIIAANRQLGFREL